MQELRLIAPQHDQIWFRFTCFVVLVRDIDRRSRIHEIPSENPSKPFMQEIRSNHRRACLALLGSQRPLDKLEPFLARRCLGESFILLSRQHLLFVRESFLFRFRPF